MNSTETKGRSKFLTRSNIEVPSVTADQMREVDRVAMQETGPNLYQMMENAGRNLASIALELQGSSSRAAKFLVLAGAGGNGGGGICTARHLANHGFDVSLCMADPQHLGEVPAYQYKIFQGTSGKQRLAVDLKGRTFDLILDALIGYGLKSAPRGTVARLIRWANDSGIPVLALDLPSGINATTGEGPGDFIKAKWTMTLALPKTGLLPESTGDLFLADIGIPQAAYQKLGLAYSSPFGDRYWIPLRLTE